METRVEGGAIFTCETCSLSTPFTYFGQKPPNTRAIVQVKPYIYCQLKSLNASAHLRLQFIPPSPLLILSRLLEESYVLKDPFSPDREKFIVLGSSCTVCSKVVCVGTVCSFDFNHVRDRFLTLDYDGVVCHFFHVTLVSSLYHLRVNLLHVISVCFQECSLFYTRRFCLPCVRENLDQFPQQIQVELAKKKAPLHTQTQQGGCSLRTCSLKGIDADKNTCFTCVHNQIAQI